MRRFILIFMMLLLPLQWSWAAAASVCAHEQGSSHFGHHEHEHEHSPLEAANAHEDAADAAPAEHLDCQVCHGVGSACLSAAAAIDAPWLPSGLQAAYGRHVPEPPIEPLLRPPLTLVA